MHSLNLVFLLCNLCSISPLSKESCYLFCKLLDKVPSTRAIIFWQDVYDNLNIFMRRKPKENNFKVSCQVFRNIDSRTYEEGETCEANVKDVRACCLQGVDCQNLRETEELTHARISHGVVNELTDLYRRRFPTILICFRLLVECMSRTRVCIKSL